MEFSSGEELLRFWRQEDREQIDILFLDISMDGTDGMETAEQIRAWQKERNEPLWGSLPLLIFVTGHPEYMAKAFSFRQCLSIFSEAHRRKGICGCIHAGCAGVPASGREEERGDEGNTRQGRKYHKKHPGG